MMVFNPKLIGNVKRYAPNRPIVEAIKITASTLEEAALWCGGEVRDEQTRDGIFKYVAIPTLSGPHEARPGNYLVKTPDNKFDVRNANEFEEEYTMMGQRQDGLVYRGDRVAWATPLQNVDKEYANVQPKGWGANSDSP